MVCLYMPCSDHAVTVGCHTQGFSILSSATFVGLQVSSLFFHNLRREKESPASDVNVLEEMYQMNEKSLKIRLFLL
jgi:hypothetical protein